MCDDDEGVCDRVREREREKENKWKREGGTKPPLPPLFLYLCLSLSLYVHIICTPFSGGGSSSTNGVYRQCLPPLSGNDWPFLDKIGTLRDDGKIIKRIKKRKKLTQLTIPALVIRILKGGSCIMEVFSSCYQAKIANLNWRQLSCISLYLVISRHHLVRPSLSLGCLASALPKAWMVLLSDQTNISLSLSLIIITQHHYFFFLFFFSSVNKKMNLNFYLARKVKAKY